MDVTLGRPVTNRLVCGKSRHDGQTTVLLTFQSPSEIYGCPVFAEKISLELREKEFYAKDHIHGAPIITV
jgi:hypothetical protein